jgi:hypothetical protein
LRLPAGTAGFFFFRERAILAFFRMARDTCMVEIDLIKASSSCLSILILQELLLTTERTKLLTRWQPREQVPQIMS